MMPVGGEESRGTAVSDFPETEPKQSHPVTMGIMYLGLGSGVGGSLDVGGGAAVGGGLGHQWTQTTLSILFCLTFVLGLGSREEESCKSISKKERS